MFFKKVATKQEEDLHDKIIFIIHTLLQRELPEHRSQHHILYTANTKLLDYRERAEMHRTHAYTQTALSHFHQQAYDKLLKKHNQLQLLIDVYMELHLNLPRELYNHRLRLDDQQIKLVYEELHRMHDYHLSSEQESSFWHAIKEQIFPTFAKLVA